MPRLLDRSGLFSGWFNVLLCSGILFLVTGAIQVLPPMVASALAAWILASIPLGIGIGHCVLSEE